MSKILVIVGEPNTGKSVLSKILTKEKNTVVLNGRNKNFLKDAFRYSQIDENTECLVIDDLNEKDFEKVVLETYREIRIEKKRERPFTLKAPKVIITTNFCKSEYPESIKNRIEVLRIPKI